MNPHLRHKGNYRHGMSYTPVWNTYVNIKQRCSDKSGKNAKWYANIKCQWATFEEFYQDMGDKPSPQHSIERLNNKGDYCKENCIWATSYVQSRNTSQNRWLTFMGRKQCLTDWAKEVGLKKLTLHARLHYGWSVAEALTVPVGGKR